MAEMLVTIGIVGVLAAILFPTLRDVFPNQEKMMFKKAYYVAERIVSELANDDDLYPASGAVDKAYLANTEEVTYKGKKYSGETKFCELFVEKVNKKPGNTCAITTFANPTVVTSDGVAWVIRPQGAGQPWPVTIQVDVNGDRKPNCAYNNSTCPKPDRFSVIVYPNGKMSPGGTIEKEYLKSYNVNNENDIK